jgi:6-pyruvoyltetrahydropterin/6-carboxytetrahydropterin synthase
MITVTRRYHFEAAHFLPKVHENHKCRRLHGHNYEIEVEIMHDDVTDERGFVIDFAELDEVINPIIARVDHRCLNDLAGLDNPTAELIGQWFLDEIVEEGQLPMHTQIVSIKVFETKDCWAIVTPSV